jgi:hypothetical protein
MKTWKILVCLEVEWRILRYYRRLMNLLIKRRLHLSSPPLCFLSKKMDKHGILISSLKMRYENMTGKIVVFYP